MAERTGITGRRGPRARALIRLLTAVGVGVRRGQAVRLLSADVGDVRGRVGRRVQRARGLGPPARQLAAARLDADRRLLLHHRAARVRGRRAGPRAGRGCGAHQRRDHLHAAGARGGRARPGPGQRRRGLGAGADRGRDHARAAARQRRPRAARAAGSRGHPGAAAGDLPAGRPRTASLLHGRRSRSAARGRGRRRQDRDRGRGGAARVRGGAARDLGARARRQTTAAAVVPARAGGAAGGYAVGLAQLAITGITTGGSREPVETSVGGPTVGHLSMAASRTRSTCSAGTSGRPSRARRPSSPGCTRPASRSRRRPSASRCGGCPAAAT